MLIAGVDPGATGAIALLSDGKFDVVFDMPVGKIKVGKTMRNRISPEMLAADLWKHMPIDVVYIEEVTAMPKQGVSSVFTFGQAHGLVLGAFASLGTRIVRIRPQEWQRIAGARGDPRPRACELHPEATPLLRRKKDEGRADAILIAHAGWLKENNA